LQRQFGDALWIVFNLVPAELRGGQQLSETAMQALTFCREIGTAIHHGGMECRIGVATEAVARAGMASPDRLLFDLYAPAMGIAASLARQALPGTALITQAIGRFEERMEMLVVQLHVGGVRDDAFYELQIA
jgi:hypothetical protein